MYKLSVQGTSWVCFISSALFVAVDKRDEVDQYHKQGYCMAGFSVSMTAVSFFLLCRYYIEI